MLRRAAFLLVPLALAGCGGASSDGVALQKQEQTRAADLAKVDGWDRAFQPDVAVGAAKQFGFNPKPYAGMPEASIEFRSIGGPIVIANSAAKTPNTVSFAATGAAEKVDKIAFDLSLIGGDGDGDALQRTADMVRDYLFQSKIDAEPVRAAILKGEQAKGELAGTPWQIVKTPKGGVEHLTVTFTRTGASAPANS
jgi:hypothetical protein